MSLGDRLGIIGLIVALIGIGITVLWPTIRWIGWLCIVAAVCLIGGWVYVEVRPDFPTSPEKPTEVKPFAVIVASAINLVARNEVGLFWLGYERDKAYTIFPAHFAVVIRVANLKPVKTVIESYALEAKADSGTWVRLIRISTISTELFMIKGSDMRKARKVQCDMLDVKLMGHPIEPSDFVKGFSFYEIPPAADKEEFHNPIYRLQITDALDTTYMTDEMTPATRKYEGTQGLTLNIYGPEIDLSGATVRHVEGPL